MALTIAEQRAAKKGVIGKVLTNRLDGGPIWGRIVNGKKIY